MGYSEGADIFRFIGAIIFIVSEISGSEEGSRVGKEIVKTAEVFMSSD